MGTCKDLGGSLATLDTQAMNAFIIGNLAMITGTCDVWLSVGNLNPTLEGTTWLAEFSEGFLKQQLAIDSIQLRGFSTKKGEEQLSEEWNWFS